jgi:hypothetical protein
VLQQKRRYSSAKTKKVPLMSLKKIGKIAWTVTVNVLIGAVVGAVLVALLVLAGGTVSPADAALHPEVIASVSKAHLIAYIAGPALGIFIAGFYSYLDFKHGE